MAERRKNKKKKEVELRDPDKKPSKEEYVVAKYLRKHLPEKKTTLLGHKVEYFIGSRAVDCLLESPWAKDDTKEEFLFPNRESIVDFMAILLEDKFFHRAKKIIVTKESKKKKKEEEAATESPKEKEPKKSKSKSESKEKKEKEKSKGGKESEAADKKKEKKKIKLDMHLEQLFIDSNEPYVWIYDPIPMQTWIIGALMVIAAVLVCLFPLWPQSIRHYIYYLSVAAAFFLVFIIGLAILRLIVFVLIWLVTFGKHHLWLLPNLTEDVGFLESFWPLYMYEYKGKKEEQDKDSPKAEEEEEEEDESPKNTEEQELEKKDEKSDESSTDEKADKSSQVESEQDKSDRERPKDENGFEFIEAEEIESEEDDEDDKNDDEEEEEAEEEDRKTK